MKTIANIIFITCIAICAIIIGHNYDNKLMTATLTTLIILCIGGICEINHKKYKK